MGHNPRSWLVVVLQVVRRRPKAAEIYRRGLARSFRQTGSLYHDDVIDLDEHPDRLPTAAVAVDADLWDLNDPAGYVDGEGQ